MSLAEIKKLPLREKFQIMEALWEDMRETIDTIPFPDEHTKLLDQRLDRLESGKEQVHDWDDIKDADWST